MNEGGISRRLINLSNVLIGKVRGGLAMVNVLASTFSVEYQAQRLLTPRLLDLY